MVRHQSAQSIAPEKIKRSQSIAPEKIEPSQSKQERSGTLSLQSAPPPVRNAFGPPQGTTQERRRS